MNVDALLGAGIALCSGLAGAFVQGVIGRRSEYIKAGRQARYGAYADYFKGVGMLSHLKADDQASAHALIADARSRIALYGSPSVISAMNDVFEHGDDICSDRAREDLSKMLAIMRADVLWIEAEVPKEDLVTIVYGKGR